MTDKQNKKNKFDASEDNDNEADVLPQTKADGPAVKAISAYREDSFNRQCERAEENGYRLASTSSAVVRGQYGDDIKMTAIFVRPERMLK